MFCLLHTLCGVVFIACMNLAMFWTDCHCANTLLPLSAFHGLDLVPGFFIYLFYLLLLCIRFVDVVCVILHY